MTWPKRYPILGSPVLVLILWVLPLLVVQSSQQSFMAHDEGIYASQAKTILEFGDWIRPGQFNYDRTIGIQWIIALCFQGLGMSEGVARLPSSVAALVGVILTYRIGAIVFKPSIAFLGALILAVTPLWAQYSRLATQDMVLVSLELLSIWALLRGECTPPESKRWIWGGLAGLGLGLGVFIKGFMMLPVVVALLPYLLMPYVLRGQRHHGYLTNLGLYLGAVVGLLPLGIWLGLSVQRYGTMPLYGLFGKLFVLSQETFNRNGPGFYLWNIPANSFPWIFFSVGGIVLLLREVWLRRVEPSNLKIGFNSGFNAQWLWLFLGYPGLLFIELMLFKTRTRYYPLQLMPFLALMAAIALEALWHHYLQQQHQQLPYLQQSSSPQAGPASQAPLTQTALTQTTSFPWIAGLSYGSAGLSALLILTGGILNLSLVGVQLGRLDASLQPYGQIALGLGLGGLSVPLSWVWGKSQRTAARTTFAVRLWQRGWLLGPWLAIVLFGLTGVWGDYNPDLKSFLRQSPVAEILNNHPIHQVKAQTPLSINDRKTSLLLEFYVPERGQLVETLTALQPLDYAWLQPSAGGEPAVSEPRIIYEVIGTVRGWQLIHIH